MLRRLGLFAFLLPISLLCACKRAQPVSIQVNLQYLPGVPFEIYLEGKKVDLAVSGEPGDRKGSFAAQATLRSDQLLLPAATMRLHYPCGWREAPMELNSDWAPEYVRKAAEQHQTVAIDANPPYQSDPSMAVDVDNRGSEVHTVEVGELSYAVDGGKLASVDSYQPECAGANLKIDGTTLGSLPAATPAADPYASREGPFVLVDPTAKRCYQLRQITYDSTYMGPAPKVVDTFKGKQFYILDQKPNYVLTSAPGSVMSQAPVDYRYELTEKKCQ
jgi:hypothetical protein